MSDNPADFWTEETSVIFTSFWGWAPETWGTVGWTGPRGFTRRANLLKQLTNPFIAVIYVTGAPENEEGLKGRIAGFYLISHEMGHRDAFTHPIHHDLSEGKWEHSLRAVCAFSYLPEHRLKVADLDPGLLGRALAVSGMAEILTDVSQIAMLRDIPWVEVDVYHAGEDRRVEVDAESFPARGFNRAGPANRNGYVVSSSAQQLERQIYILRLNGGTDAYLGKSADGKSIYKIGLSASPELRRQSFQSAMPRGAFRWEIYRPLPGLVVGSSFEAAVAGEDAMKEFLAVCAEWLGGEFYLASEQDIEIAWKRGQETVDRLKKS